LIFIFLGKDSYSNLNPLAIPFIIPNEEQEILSRSRENEKLPAQLVLYEPRNVSSQGQSCQTIYQRLYHRPREDWDKHY
jgi:hypothetical protein